MATAAMRALNTKPFLDRALEIAYAKGKSDVVARLQGTWKPRERKEKLEKDAKEKPDKAKPLPGSSGEGRPGAVLFAENLPPECTEVMLTMLFRQYPGFEEVRLVAERRVAFVQFKEPNYADQALNGLQGFMVGPGHPLKLSIAKSK